MFRQILVPLDGSTPAEGALPIARRLAPATLAAVHLVRVVRRPELPWAMASTYVLPSTYDAVQASDELKAATYLEDTRARLAASGLVVCTATPAGEVEQQLLLYEGGRGIDLVVLGFHCHGGPARLALGPVTTQLLRHGRAPLLLPPPADL